MKITILTYPNSKLDHLKNTLVDVRKNAKKFVDFEVDWKKVKDCNDIGGIKIYALSDPFETIKDIYHANKSTDVEIMKQQKIISHTINENTKYNLSIYSEIEAASLSYLIWTEIVKEAGIDFIFKIENIQDLLDYLKDKGILDVGFNYNAKKFKSYKPRNLDEYKTMSYGTINLLGTYCREYDYLNFLKGLK
jgi:hypothetical protein